MREGHIAMTLIRSEGVTPELIRLAAEAEAFLRETGSFYRRMSVEARGEPGETPAKLRDRMHEYRKAALAALEDGRRVADELNRARGIVHDFALDLGLARDEVERLLDRFAAAVGAEPVP
jgi:hypothetical protein